ncbi:MAG: sugar ABC transporter substrate-binding protein [Lachnospiraceae bacterium]|nr:sugar ABC transporter substrate-binding protein [Lachnospiraceae bacterium]
MKESMKKMLIIAVIALLALVAAACGKDTKNNATDVTATPTDPGKTDPGKTDPGTPTPDPDDAILDDPDITTITFAVPEIMGRVNEDYLRKFNKALVKDGHKYKLVVKRLDFEDYNKVLRTELKTGGVDVACAGLKWADGGNEIFDLVNEGVFVNLDEILTKGRGADLYKAFPAKLWETSKCNKHSYTIPMGSPYENGLFVAFNNKYLSADAIEHWDGTLEGIYNMIKDVEWNDAAAPRFQYNLSDYDFTQLIRSEIEYGLLYDDDTLTVENPLESEKFLSLVKTFRQMKDDGFLSNRYFDRSENYSLLHSPGINDAGVLKNIESGNYLAALSNGIVDEMFLKDNITVKRLPNYISSRLGCSVGISAKTEKLDAVIDFLCLLYCDGKYANILMYGEEGVDYKLVDGIVCNPDGSASDTDIVFARMVLNLYANLHPLSGEPYSKDRKNQVFALYDSVELSPFIGFEPDTSKMNNISKDISNFVEDVSLGISTWDKLVADAREKLKADGIDEYLESVRSQWEAFRQEDNSDESP